MSDAAASVTSASDAMPPWLQAPWEALHRETDPRLQLAELHHLAEVCTRVVVALGRTELEDRQLTLATAHTEYARAVLQRPAFGNWIDMARHVALALPAGRLRDAAEQVAALRNDGRDVSVVTLRNHLAHGHRARAEEAREHVDAQSPVVMRLARALELAVAGSTLEPEGEPTEPVRIRNCRWRGPSFDRRVVPLLAFHGDTPLLFKSFDDRRIEYIGPRRNIRTDDDHQIEMFQRDLRLNDDAQTRLVLARPCIGRERVVEALDRGVVVQPGAAYRLHGHVQSGKSSLLAALGRTLLTRAQGERPDVFVHSFDPGDVHAFLRRLVELLRVGAHGADGEKAAVTAAKLLGRSGRRPWVFLVDGLDRLDPAVRTVWWKATEPLRAVSTWVIETSTPEAYPTALPLLPDGVQRLDTAAVTAILSEYLSHVPGIFVDDAAREALATAVCERSGGWPLYVRMVGEDLRNHADPAKLLRDGYLSTLPQSVEHAYEKELRDQALTDVGATAIRVLALLAAYSAPIDLASIRALFAWGDAWGDPDGYAAGLTSDRSLDGAVAILRKRLVNVTSRAGTRTLSLAEPALTSYLTTTTTLASSIHRERVLLSRAVCEEPTCPGEAPPDHTALVDWLWQRGVDVVLTVGDAHARRRCATLRSDPQYLLARAKRRHATGGGDVPAPTHTKDYGCVVRCLDDVERLTLEFPDDARLHRACAELRLVRRALSRKHGTLERTLRVAMAVCGDDEAWATTVHGLLVDGEGTPRGRQQAFVDASRLLTLHRLVNGANVSTRLVNVMERMRQDVDATLDAVGSDALQQADVWNSVGQVSHNTGDSLHGDDATPSYTFAVQCFERSLALLTQAPSSAGNPDDVRYGIFIVKYNLANALVALGDTDAARIQFTEAWRCAEENAEPHTKDAGALETWVKNWGLPILRLLKHAHKAGARLREPDSVNAAWLVRLGAPNALAATHAVGSDDPVHASLTPLYLWQAGIDS